MYGQGQGPIAYVLTAIIRLWILLMMLTFMIAGGIVIVQIIGSIFGG